MTVSETLGMLNTFASEVLGFLNLPEIVIQEQ
jgi:hypothetical protein